jgi:hypothetical protein
MCLFYLFIILVSGILLENTLTVANLVLCHGEIHGIGVLEFDLDSTQCG